MVIDTINLYDYGRVLYIVVHCIMSKCFTEKHSWVIGGMMWWNSCKPDSSS